MALTFKKRKEDFICEHCGESVLGDGFTNHCPKCLWSKHVDVNPGDRASTCGGLMEPVSVEVGRGGEYLVIHECVTCKYRKKNKVSPQDDFDTILSIAQQSSQT
jgi:hypothetical protein